MTTVILQNPLTSAHERFARGGSWLEFGYALLAIAALVLLLMVLHSCQQRRASRRIEDDPKKLFRVMLRRLGLGVLQRDLLRRMARDLDLKHPTTLLLSPVIFRQQVHRWSRQFEEAPRAWRPPDPEELDAVCETLYGRRLRPS